MNCAAFVAGIVHGILDAADFVRSLQYYYNTLISVQTPESVEAYSVPVEGQRIPKTVIVVKFKQEVIARTKQP